MQRVTNRLLAIVLIAFSFGSASTFALDTNVLRTYRGTVVKVVDGDTINMVPDGASGDAKPFRIRMISTDTPETHLPGRGGPYSQGYWGKAAAEELRSLVRVGDRIELDSYGVDHYGRVLGKVYKGARNINLEMIESGWAALYVICDAVSCEMEAEYRAACRRAMQDGRGIFNPARPIPQLPFVFRSEKQERPLSKFVGNFRTKKYVAPENFEDVALCDRVFFMTEADARNEGYTRSRSF